MCQMLSWEFNKTQISPLRKPQSSREVNMQASNYTKKCSKGENISIKCHKIRNGGITIVLENMTKTHMHGIFDLGFEVD